VTVLPAVSAISRPETAGLPYITATEFQNAPTGLQTNNLVPGGSAAEQFQALQAQILRASSWMDGQCHQVLASTVDTEISRANVRRDGSVMVFTRCFPVRVVTAVSMGWQLSDLTALTSLDTVTPLNRVFLVESAGIPFASSQGPLQFGPTYGPYGECWVQYSYVNGYPVTTLSAGISVGATSIVPASVLGILPGMTLTLSDIPLTETVTVSPTYVVGQATVPLLTGTQSPHVAGIAVSALPDAVKQAAILATAGFVQERGSGALVMASISGGPTKGAPMGGAGFQYLADALAILKEGGFVAQVSVPGML